MTTIHDVATRAGVSRSTVSYALSGKRAISQETRQRIEEAIRELGFTPNAGARALATSQTMVLGLLLQFHQDEFRAGDAPVRPARLAAGPRARLRHPHGHGGRRPGRAATDRRLGHGRRGRPPRRRRPGPPGARAAHDPPARRPARPAARHRRGRRRRPRLRRGGPPARRPPAGAGAPRGRPRRAAPSRRRPRGGAYAWRFRDAAVDRAARYGLRVHVYHGESRQPGITVSVNGILDAHPDATALVVHNDATIAALRACCRTAACASPTTSASSASTRATSATSSPLPYTAVESAAFELGERAVTRLVDRLTDPAAAGHPVVRFVAPVLQDRGSTRSLP